MRVQGLIVGGGIIGSAVAWELSRQGVDGLHVIDPDLEGSLSSTERNAGGVRHLWQQPINTELSRASIAFFDQIATEIGFQRTGYLWLFSGEQAEQGQRLYAESQARKLDYVQISPGDIRNKYPFIDKTDDLAFGIFGAKDGLINANALKNYYREEAKKKGVTFHDRKLLVDLQSAGNTSTASVSSFGSQEEAQGYLTAPTRWPTKSETWTADFIILCGGPWMCPLLQRLTSQSLVTPIRRQICLFKAEGLDMTPYGMIVDTSRVYFHPEGGNMLAGIVLPNEPEGFRFHFDDDFFESHIWPALYERSSKMERLKPITGWGGLYSYTPDTTGILGALPGYSRVYEAHSFTGRGVMQSYGAAVAMAELVLNGRFRAIDAKYLSRERFQDPKRYLPEGLHI